MPIKTNYQATDLNDLDSDFWENHINPTEEEDLDIQD